MVAWGVSALVLTFEYRRALGHIWYMHPFFVWFSVLVYAGDLLYTVFWPERDEYGDNDDRIKKRHVLNLVL